MYAIGVLAAALCLTSTVVFLLGFQDAPPKSGAVRSVAATRLLTRWSEPPLWVTCLLAVIAVLLVIATQSVALQDAAGDMTPFQAFVVVPIVAVAACGLLLTGDLNRVAYNVRHISLVVIAVTSGLLAARYLFNVSLARLTWEIVVGLLEYSP